MISKSLIGNVEARAWNRRLAWLLVLLIILIMASGYALIGKLGIMPISLARKIHRIVMPLTILIFVFHAYYGSLLLLVQRKARKIAREKSKKTSS